MKCHNQMIDVFDGYRHRLLITNGIPWATVDIHVCTEQSALARIYEIK
jgi:hypothetical protein